MTTSIPLGDGLHSIDLNFQGQPGVITSYLLQSGGERALIEVGPGSTLDSLLGGLQAVDVDPGTIDKVLVTHIHLDHAGAAGAFLRRFPRAQFYVHEIGLPHMIDPAKLIASATRIYGDMMGPLWGDFEPVPEDRATALADGDIVSVGDMSLRALYTPGHASHHVVYHDEERRRVFTGDVAGVRLAGMQYVRPPTPPPDLDLEAWQESIERVRALRPDALYLTHFGPFPDVGRHLDDTRDRLLAWAKIVREAIAGGQDQPELVDNLRLHGDAELRRETDDAAILQRYELATPYGMTVDGFRRYFRKRAA